MHWITPQGRWSITDTAKKKKWSLEDVEQLGGDPLSAEEVSRYLGVNPQAIREQARRDKSLLGFPVIACGVRVQMPKEGFLNFCRGWSSPSQKKGESMQ